MGRKVDIKFTIRFWQQTTKIDNKRRIKNLNYRCFKGTINKLQQLDVNKNICNNDNIEIAT